MHAQRRVIFSVHLAPDGAYPHVPEKAWVGSLVSFTHKPGLQTRLLGPLAVPLMAERI